MRWSASIAILMLLPSTAAEPWLMDGHDAARTGATQDPGPETFDLAFSVDLPGPRPSGVAPLILDGNIYTLAGGDDPSLWRVDLATAKASRVASFETAALSSLAGDGQRFFVAGSDGIMAIGLHGELAWEWAFPTYFVGPVATFCAPHAVRGGQVFIGCTQTVIADFPAQVIDTLPPGQTLVAPSYRSATQVFAAALDATNGKLAWLWTKSVGDELGDSLEAAGATSEPLAVATSLAIIGDRVLVSMYDGAGAGGLPSGQAVQSLYSMFVLSAADGSFLWRWSSAEQAANVAADPTNPYQSDGGQHPLAMTGTSQEFYVKDTAGVHALDPITGQLSWNTALRQASDPVFTGNALALAGDRLFVTAYSHAYAMDLPTHSITWVEPVPSREDWEGNGGLVTANGIVFASTYAGRVFAFDGRDGHLLWQDFISSTSTLAPRFRYAVGEGVFVVQDADGGVLVYGRTAASIDLRMNVQDAYPQAHSAVRVDLSPSQPGVQDATLEFHADWGDGTTTEWQASPVMNHTYAFDGDRLAKFQARNPAGQQASATMTFHVGGTPPPELNFMQRAFAPENQNLTFFIIGLAVTLLGGFLGFVRLRRRLYLLQRELAAVNRAYESTKGRVAECERALAERQAYAKVLLADGKLDEGKYAVLEHRIEELQRAVRTQVLDERFDFLPRGLANRMEQLLADGTVTTWERDAFEVLLREDKLLTKAQKQQVRQLLRRWSTRDGLASSS